MDEIKDRLRELRTNLRRSQKEFSAKMGVKQNTYSNLELGVNPCSDRWINLVCLTYNVREDWLRNGTGEMFKSAQNQPPKPVIADIDKHLPPDIAELITICQELMPLNRDTVLSFAETTLQAQRNTIKALENENAKNN